MSRFVRKSKPPAGFDYIAPTLNMLENELREKVSDGHEGKRKTEAMWPIHQINWQRSRYIYDMFYKYGKISKEVYNYCVLNKLVDAGLIAKWKKPGYERLCSTYVINTKNYKFGTTSICRVPKYALGPDTVVEDPFTGCLGCASGPGGQRNIFGNKYGQYLAAIQVAREEERARREASKARAALEASGKGKGAASGGGDESDEEEDGPSPPGIWAANEVERNMENFEGDAAAAGAESASKRGASSEDQEEPKRARY